MLLLILLYYFLVTLMLITINFEDISLNGGFGCSLDRWIECNSLFQVINEPTCVTSHGSHNNLLIYSPGFFVDFKVFSPPSTCDHSMIYARMNISFFQMLIIQTSVRHLSLKSGMMFFLTIMISMACMISGINVSVKYWRHLCVTGL